jgi:nicotinate-nucleotide adenylyltransferase
VKRLGVMGGTFDPIHHGHLVAAEEVRHAFDLDLVLFVPAGDPWQKAATDVSPASERLKMTERAVVDNPAFEVSSMDVDRDGPTYTVDTLRDLTDVHPGATLYFITGADAILDILTWKDPHEVVELATFVAVSRPGSDLGRLDALGLGDAVVTLQIPALAISSTDIRERVAGGKPIRYLVPDQVERYIAEQGLYRPAQN